MLAELLGAVDAQRATGAEAPLFLYWHLMEPHAPYLAHTDLEETFPFRADLPTDWHQARYDAIAEVDAQVEADGWHHVNAGRTRYEREVRKADDAVAALLVGLEERGLDASNTLLVIASDHGEGLWDHPTLIVPEVAKQKPPNEFFHKEHAMFLYEEFVHTPLVFHGPGVPAGTVVTEATENVDVYPTLLHLLDLPSPGRLHGESLVPIWAGEPQRSTDAHAFVIHFGMIREGDTGLKIHVPSNAGAGVGAKLQLYASGTDRAEQDDLAAQRSGDAQRLHAKLTDWVAAHPTLSTLDRERSLAEKDDLQAMGYAGEDDERVNPKDG
jgi:arylsulfatase A-like enzyme